MYTIADTITNTDPGTGRYSTSKENQKVSVNTTGTEMNVGKVLEETILGYC